MSLLYVASIRQCFTDIPDPRREHMRLHNLWDILAVTIAAVTAGADNWVDVAKYAVKKLAFLKTFLELPNGAPSHDTLNRVFALLKPTALQDGFVEWVKAIAKLTDGRLVAIDGKTARHSFDKASGKGPLHMITAWVSENRLVLGQQACDSKSNEITAIPELLQKLELRGSIVTIDAMGCQKNIAAAITDAKAD